MADIEKKAEDFGRNIEDKINTFEHKAPKPLNAFLDAVCISVCILGISWIIKKLKWTEGMIDWLTLGIIFCSIFAVSLVYRLIIKPRRNPKK